LTDSWSGTKNFQEDKNRLLLTQAGSFADNTKLFSLASSNSNKAAWWYLKLSDTFQQYKLQCPDKGSAPAP
jgi:hypothetical protein